MSTTTRPSSPYQCKLSTSFTVRQRIDLLTLLFRNFLALLMHKSNTQRVQSTTQAERFYKTVLEILIKNRVHFLIGGTYAVSLYTGINRPTKDLDIYTKAGDYMHILELFQVEGYMVEI